MTLWSIYTLHDPREPAAVRYVGWTTAPARRAKDHANPNKGHGKLSGWKRELHAAGLVPVLTVIEQGTGVKAGRDAEVRWIAHYRVLMGEKLTNTTIGGVGVNGYTFTAEVKAKMSKSHLGRKLAPHVANMLASMSRGRVVSADTRAKIRAARIGKKLSPEHVQALRDAHPRLKPSAEDKRKQSEGLRRYHAKRKETAPPSKRDHVADLLRSGVSDRGALALAIYGEDTKRARDKVSALISGAGLTR